MIKNLRAKVKQNNCYRIKRTVCAILVHGYGWKLLNIERERLVAPPKKTEILNFKNTKNTSTKQTQKSTDLYKFQAHPFTYHNDQDPQSPNGTINLQIKRDNMCYFSTWVWVKMMENGNWEESLVGAFRTVFSNLPSNGKMGKRYY